MGCGSQGGWGGGEKLLGVLLDLFQGQMNILSRITDKYNYSVFNVRCTPNMKGPHVEAQTTVAFKSHVRHHTSQSF